MNAAYNCLFGTPNYLLPSSLLSPTLSGGNWLTALPLANLQDRQLNKVARSADATAASSKFIFDLKAQRDLRVLALLGDNISRTGQIRYRLSNTNDGVTNAVYDSGLIDAWPLIYPPRVLPWGMPGNWDGKISDEDAVGYPMLRLIVLAAPVFAQYGLIEIVDTANPAGYLQAGQFVPAAGYQPSLNMEYGAKLAWESATVRQETDGSGTVFYPKTSRRSVAFGFNAPEQDEALALMFDLQRRLALDKQLLFVFDPTDTYHAHRRSFLGVFRTLQPLAFPDYLHNTTGFEVVEEL